MMSNRTQVLGIFSRLIIYILGIFSFIYVFRVLNVKNAIIGYFYKEPEVVKISDFEYDFKSLLFTNSGASDNEYFARVNAKPVSNFDKTKKYTVTINGIHANRVYGDYNYINSNFTNTFLSTQDTTLLTDTLNIKINFYTEETMIVFTTQSGEQAINLWSSYIAKNGFVLKIVEDNYIPQIEADNLSKYKVDLCFGSEIINSFYRTAINDFYLPVEYKGFKINSWKDEDNNYYINSTKDTIPFKDIKLYAVVDETRLNFSINQNTITKVTKDIETTSDVKYSARFFLDNYSITDLDSSNIYELMNTTPKNYGFKFSVENFYVDYIDSDFMANPDYVCRNSGDGFVVVYVARNPYNDATYKYNLKFTFSIKNNIVTPYLDIVVRDDNGNFKQFERDLENKVFNFNINIEIFKK